MHNNHSSSQTYDFVRCFFCVSLEWQLAWKGSTFLYCLIWRVRSSRREGRGERTRLEIYFFGVLVYKDFSILITIKCGKINDVHYKNKLMVHVRINKYINVSTMLYRIKCERKEKVQS